MLLDLPVGPTEVRFYADVEQHIIIRGEQRSMCGLEPPIFVARWEEPRSHYIDCPRCQKTLNMVLLVKLAADEPFEITQDGVTTVVDPREL